jgi:hypothetical protein
MFAGLRLKKTFVLVFTMAAMVSGTAFAVSTADLKKKFEEEPAILIKAGAGLYNQTGANSCLYCHGTAVEVGKVATAARIHEPRTWKIYKILGGDAAFAKDRADFLKKMQEATENLIVKGAVSHNVSYKQPWFDVAKGGGAFDSQMVGLAGPPSRAWVRKYEKTRGMTAEVAAHAVYEYIKTLDSQGVF